MKSDGINRRKLLLDRGLILWSLRQEYFYLCEAGIYECLLCPRYSYPLRLFFAAVDTSG
jgi:hypothetical protein